MNKSFDLSKYIEKGLAKSYAAQLSENIKRGIRAAKERKQKNENK